MARRFIIEKDLSNDEEFIITGVEAKHIFVLRYYIGEIIEINNKLCEILDINKQSVRCKVVGNAKAKGIPRVKITLFQAFLKSDKMDFVVQKAVELGVSEIVPFISKNVVVKIEDKDKAKKIERLNKISKEASKQCGRSDIVNVDTIYSFDDVLKGLKKHKKCIVAYENETARLKEFLKDNCDVENVAIIIGAEGGFNQEEVDLLVKNGCTSVSLGDRILRAETASLNLISILMYELN